MHFIADLAAKATPTDWVVDGLLPAGSVVMVAGSPKHAKKTLTCMHLGLCVAQAQAFFGRSSSCRRVVYSMLEDGEKRAARRLKALGVGPGHQGVRMACTVTEEEFWKASYALGQTIDPVLWIIDPLIELQRLHGIHDENNSNEISRLLNVYRGIAHQRGHAIVIVHHFRKAGDVMRGSGAMTGSVDGWWDMTPARKNVVKLASTMRDEEPQEIGVELLVSGDKRDRRFSFKEAVLSKVDEADHGGNGNGRPKHGGRKSAFDKVIAVLRDRPHETWTRAALLDATQLAENTLDKHLNTGVKANLIEPVSYGSSQRVYRFVTHDGTVANGGGLSRDTGEIAW